MHTPSLFLSLLLGYQLDATGERHMYISIFDSNFPGDLSDSTATRTLGVGMGVAGQVDRESCTEACANAGYPLAGVEYAAECCEPRIMFDYTRVVADRCHRL